MGGQRGGVGGVGDAPQQLGHPEGGPVADHGDVGHHGDEQASGLADPVDGGDDRRRLSRMARNGRTSIPTPSGTDSPVLGPPAQVAPGGEHVPDAGDDQGGQVGVGVDQSAPPA